MQNSQGILFFYISRAGSRAHMHGVTSYRYTQCIGCLMQYSTLLLGTGNAAPSDAIKIL